MIPLDKKLKQSDSFHVADIEGEQMLLNPATRSGVYLDLAASLIWRLCDGTRSAREITDEVAELYVEDESFDAGDVTETLARLHELKAIILVGD